MMPHPRTRRQIKNAEASQIDDSVTNSPSLPRCPPDPERNRGGGHMDSVDSGPMTVTGVPLARACWEVPDPGAPPEEAQLSRGFLPAGSTDGEFWE